ncbi:unnamed protein product [Dovyalis caffra]|uniref:Uncharacterized protein n=1 Tax=Dovyalis caffra TaxID=77055 RepID=A0AAV1QW77_9ROSI|nr:unnamed protein product [Dovyalis caffra]
MVVKGEDGGSTTRKAKTIAMGESTSKKANSPFRTKQKPPTTTEAQRPKKPKTNNCQTIKAPKGKDE